MHFKELTKVFSSERYMNGEILFRQGDKDGDGFIVLEGSVELIKEYNGVLQSGLYIYKGGIFGVYKTIFEQDERSFTAIVKEPSTIIKIPEAVLENKLASTDPFILFCIRSWSELNTKIIQNNKVHYQNKS